MAEPLARDVIVQLYAAGPDGHGSPSGLTLLNEGTFVIYPGSIYDDGRLVYWEDSPDED